MIRNVAIHVSNEQPLLADLYNVPTPADVGMLCTNVRTMDGKRPVFIDRIDSTFFFPYRVIRFIEVSPEELRRHQAESEGGLDIAGTADAAAASDNQRLPVLAITAERQPEEPAADEEPDLGLEIDEDFLQRIRDI